MNVETVIIIAAVVIALLYFAWMHKNAFTGLTAKLEGIEKQLGLIHTTASAPVTVALVPAQPPAAQAVATTTAVTAAPAALVSAPAVAPSVTDLLFPGANQPGDARTQPSAEPIPPDFFVMDGLMRNGRTALVYGTDNGVLFGAKPGKTSYTISIPAGAQYAQSLQFNKDGVKSGKESCTVSVNGGVTQDVYQTGSPNIVLRFPGDYTVDVECDALFTMTPSFTA